MKKLRAVLCSLLCLTILFTVTACGEDNAFKGNFKKEATAEQITLITTDVKKAASDGAVETIEDADGVKLSLDYYMKVVSDGVTTVSKLETSHETALVDGKIVSATEVEGEYKSGDKKQEIEYDFYFDNDNVYINADGVKKYVNVGTPIIGNTIANSVNNMLKSYMMTGAISSLVDDIVACSAEQLSNLGVKVYVDDSGKTTKIKYAMNASVVANMEGYEESAIDFDEYSVVIVLDQNKALYGVKVVVDYTVRSGENSITNKMEASIRLTDEKPDMPSFKKYEQITDLQGFNDLFKNIG